MLQFQSLKFPLLLAITFIAGTTAAQTTKTDTLRNNLDEVVVTATRSAVKKSNTPQSITVITGKDIALTPSQEFTDVLKKNSSINIVQYPGLLSGVGIRGFRPQNGTLNQRTLLLVDGRPAGTTNLASVNTSDIERIEILKGPASALYGSQAMGGVVNVITRKSTGDIHTNISAEYGSFETLQLKGNSGGNITKKLDFDLSFNTFDQNKNIKLGQGNFFRKMLNGGSATKIYADSTVQVNDKRSDGLKREYSRVNYNSGSLRLGYQLSAKWRVNIRGERFAARNVETPSDIASGNLQPSAKDIDRNNGEVSISGNLSKHQLSLKAYLAGETSNSNSLTSGGVLIAPYLSFQSTATWKGLQLKDIYTFGNQAIIAGIDDSKATTTSRSFNSNQTERSPYSPNYNLHSTAAYVQGQFSLLQNKLIINPGARVDLISYEVLQTPLLNTYSPGKVTNPFFTPSLSAQYQLCNFFTPHATVGRAFVTPDAYNVAGYSELISNNKASIIQGNADLKNENSTSWDAGLRLHSKGSAFSADFTYFNSYVKDRITTQRTIPTTPETTKSGYVISSRTTYINANKANINGLEGEASFDLGTLLSKNYSLRIYANGTRTLKAEEVTIAASGATTTNKIYNVADFTANYGIDYNNLKFISLRLNARYVGKRRDVDFTDPLAPAIDYPAFMVADFVASFKFAQKHTVSFLVSNITDENYYEKRGFNLQGRTLSIRYAISL